MRGASCSVDALLYQEMKAGLFPDNCYRYVSGGSPDAIVDLTYEEFLEIHEKYYHLSNSYVVLDGNLNIEHTLSIIDEVLSDFEKKSGVFLFQLRKEMGIRY